MCSESKGEKWVNLVQISTIQYRCFAEIMIPGAQRGARTYLRDWEVIRRQRTGRSSPINRGN